MEWLRYPLAPSASINLWSTGEVQFTPVATTDETFEAEVNLHEAYVQIVYPVRAAFLASYDLSEYPRPEGPFSTLHFPDENNRLDFSTFIHTPTVSPSMPAPGSRWRRRERTPSTSTPAGR